MFYNPQPKGEKKAKVIKGLKKSMVSVANGMANRQNNMANDVANKIKDMANSDILARGVANLKKKEASEATTKWVEGLPAKLSTYKYRDAEKRRKQQRDLMRKRRAEKNSH